MSGFSAGWPSEEDLGKYYILPEPTPFWELLQEADRERMIRRHMLFGGVASIVDAFPEDPAEGRVLSQVSAVPRLRSVAWPIRDGARSITVGATRHDLRTMSWSGSMTSTTGASRSAITTAGGAI